LSGVKVDYGEIMVEDAADTCDAGGMNEVPGGCQAQEGVKGGQGNIDEYCGGGVSRKIDAAMKGRWEVEGRILSERLELRA